MAAKKLPHITVFRPKSGTGVEQLCLELASHAKATGHGIDDLIAELAWQWFRHSQALSTHSTKEEN